MSIFGSTSPALADLRPAQKAFVLDLVREAGLDVSDWSNSRRGQAGARTNPKYCYEWVFVEPGNAIVLNLWHEVLVADVDERIVHRGNFRKDAADQIARGRANPWGRRAQRLDAALQLALRDGLRVRVILNAGVRRDPNDPDASASKVTQRQLDLEPWTIVDYDWDTGAHMLARGARVVAFVDQFFIDAEAGGPARRREQTGSVFVRDPGVRRAVLLRAKGRCEHCGLAGFKCPDGSIYLETHHVTPLHEGGPDTTDNVVALCPSDHREAHYGAAAAALRKKLAALVAAAQPARTLPEAS